MNFFGLGLGGLLGGGFDTPDFDAQARAQAHVAMEQARMAQERHYGMKPEGIIIDAEYEIVEPIKLLASHTKEETPS